MSALLIIECQEKLLAGIEDKITFMCIGTMPDLTHIVCTNIKVVFQAGVYHKISSKFIICRMGTTCIENIGELLIGHGLLVSILCYQTYITTVYLITIMDSQLNKLFVW